MLRSNSFPASIMRRLIVMTVVLTVLSFVFPVKGGKVGAGDALATEPDDCRQPLWLNESGGDYGLAPQGACFGYLAPAAIFTVRNNTAGTNTVRWQGNEVEAENYCAQHEVVIDQDGEQITAVALAAQGADRVYFIVQGVAPVHIEVHRLVSPTIACR